MKLKLYNTETRKKEEIVPLDGKKVRLYTCGPTIYDFAHIGNFRTYVFEDILKRTLKFLGYSVLHVMNITDIDDKTIRGALKKNISLKEYTEPFKKAFFEDLDALGIERADHYPAATEYIEEMIQIIQGLLDKGFAYRGADQSIYFSIQKFPSYGRLSHLKLDELQKGASQRILADEYEKENVSDFVLWKAYDLERDGNIFWESPFGKGRPGWHIECSAMSLKLLGESFDIHCGGVDNIFPHHENEIAQSEAFTGKKFVEHWAHSEHLIVDQKKMSKSLGNFYTLRDLLKKGYSGLEVRYLLLQSHYRVQFNFTFQGLSAARSSLERFSDCYKRLEEVSGTGEKIETLMEHSEKCFSQALADDLNTSAALACLFEFVREINSLCDQKKLSKEGALQVKAFFQKAFRVLGLLEYFEEIQIPGEIQEALLLREKARKEKNWKVADEQRTWIEERGYMLEDGPSGLRVKKRR